MQGRREMLDDLKPLITNLEIEVEGKGVDQRMADNRANWAFCTNYKDAVLKSRGDRRYAIFFTAQQAPEDLARDGMTGSFFPNFWTWLRGDGYAHVAWFLKHYQIPADLDPAGMCHRAPETSSTNVAIEESRGGFEHDILDAAASSVAGFRGLPKSLAYGPTKAALINLAEALYLDLHDLGMGVSVINPGFVATPLTAGNDFTMPALISPEAAAAAIVQGWERGHFDIHFPKRFTRVMKLLRVLPYRWYFPAVRRFTGL